MGHAKEKSFTTKITASSTDTQIFTAPWRVGRRYFIKRMTITNEDGTGAAILKMYDKDTANATPPVRGDNASAPLLEYIIPQTSTVYIDDKTQINEYFGAGMVASSSKANVVIMAQIEDD